MYLKGKFKESAFTNVWALLCNLLLVYLSYTLCRVLFIVMNYSTFADYMTVSYFFHLLSAGLVFDTTAILYTNVLFVLLFLFPLHYKERPIYYKIVRWIFVIINTLAVAINVIDCVYFQFTGRRTTMSVFSEFGNEENIFGILLSESVSYFYLFLVVVAFAFVFYKLFVFPSEQKEKTHLRYYVVQSLCLLLSIPLIIIGVRGGATTATRPITLSNANQYVSHPMDAGIVLNTPFTMLRTIGKKTFVNPNYMTKTEAEKLYSPIHFPADSVAFTPKNVVVFILESFGKQHFGAYNKTLHNGNYKGYTPFLDSLIQQSYTFEYSYSNGRKSIDGMPSVLSSIPNFIEPFFLTPSALNDVSSVAGELTKKKGYQSAFFHGAMNGSMGFQAFANSVGFQQYLGRTEYDDDPRYNGEDDFDGTWAIWDEEFLQFFCDKMSDMKQPFVTSIFTASSHSPFVVPEKYKGVFPKGEEPLFECVGYTDNALRKFFEKAKNQPWFNNTLFVLTADHTSCNIEPEYLTSLGYYKVPVIYYAPGMTDLRGYDTVRIAQQIDIMPTVLGILHYDKPYVAFGQDALNTPIDEKFAVNYLPGTGIYQFLKNDYMICFDGKNVQSAYRFKTDVLLENNVLDSMSQDTLQCMTAELKSIIQQYMERMNSNELIYKE